MSVRRVARTLRVAGCGLSGSRFLRVPGCRSTSHAFQCARPARAGTSGEHGRLSVIGLSGAGEAGMERNDRSAECCNPDAVEYLAKLPVIRSREGGYIGCRCGSCSRGSHPVARGRLHRLLARRGRGPLARDHRRGAARVRAQPGSAVGRARRASCRRGNAVPGPDAEDPEGCGATGRGHGRH